MVTDMAIAHPAATQPKTLRVWPGVALAVLLVLLRFVLPVVSPTMFLHGVLGALLCALLIVLWWLFFSRAPWSARVGVIVLVVVAVWTTSHTVHPSIAGAMGFILPMYLIPVLGLVFVASAVAARRLSSAQRWVSMIVAAVAYASRGWTVQERWTSTGLKPYFNDFVVHKGHAFGFDGSILSCIDLADGKRKWKGGRYGSGQLVLLPEQDLLLVISEEGELALVSASPDQFREVSRFPGVEGKTWNHPVLVRDVLLVRNGEEMAAFRLAVSGR
jgi:hypothetical protein